MVFASQSPRSLKTGNRRTGDLPRADARETLRRPALKAKRVRRMELLQQLLADVTDIQNKNANRGS
jgi:hypothetical protein